MELWKSRASEAEGEGVEELNPEEDFNMQERSARERIDDEQPENEDSNSAI